MVLSNYLFYSLRQKLYLNAFICRYEMSSWWPCRTVTLLHYEQAQLWAIPSLKETNGKWQASTNTVITIFYSPVQICVNIHEVKIKKKIISNKALCLVYCMCFEMMSAILVFSVLQNSVRVWVCVCVCVQMQNLIWTETYTLATLID